MGTIDFLHGPGCSVDVVRRLPAMFINTDVPCLANDTLEKAHGVGSLFCPGVTFYAISSR